MVQLTSALQKEKDDAWVRVTFSDNGPGVPEEDLPKVFTPFFTSKKATGGIGLGLTISKKIVERHGGTILIESKVGSGTNVTRQASSDVEVKDER